MPIPPLLEGLLTAPGPSGHELLPARVWRESCANFASEVGGDHVGSSYARVAGTGGGPSLAIVGHIDEIGLHITHIEDGGQLRFGQVGGWDPVVLVGQRVAIQTREGSVPGVIARKPIHLLKDDDRKKVPEHQELHIDIGAKDGDESRSLVRIGDVAVIDVEPVAPAPRPSHLALTRQPGRLLRRGGGRAARGRARRRAGGRRGDGGRAGGDDLRGRAHERVRS